MPALSCIQSGTARPGQEAACFHGGAFFKAIGEDLQHLDRRSEVINADVLDAWFPPAPEVIRSIERDLAWLARTSPPTACEGLIETIAEVRSIDPSCIVVGAGSSDLIFRALRDWLNPSSRVLLLDPTYGEYAHVLERVIGCQVERFTLGRGKNYTIDIQHLIVAVQSARYDLVILVNPNSPTGQHASREQLELLLQHVPQQTRVWIDETYIDYVDSDQSLEPLACARGNLVICKSMSKVYALSGMRVAYLCGSPNVVERLRAITPPWVIGLPSQLAAITALRNGAYYAQRYQETHRLRDALARDLEQIGVEVVPNAVANFLLCHLDPSGPDARAVIELCRGENVFLRDVGSMGRAVDRFAIRIAVKDARANQRIVAVLGRALGRGLHGGLHGEPAEAAS